MRKTLGAKLIHRVTIEENKGTVSDGAGNQVPKWEPVAVNIPAYVKPVSAAQINNYSKVAQETTHLVEIRYRPNMRKDKHRVKFNGRVLSIQYIINKDEKNIELNFQCKEV